MLADYVAIEKYLHSRVACRQRGRGCRRGGGVAPPAGGRGCTPGSRGTRRGRGSVSLPTETLFVVSTHDQACGSEFIFCGSGSSIVKNYLMKSWKRQKEKLKTTELHGPNISLIQEGKRMGIHADPEPQPCLRYDSFTSLCNYFKC